MNIFGMEISAEAVAFVGILLACLVRTVMPFYIKYKKDTTIKFQWRYVLSFVVILVGGTVAAILVFPLFSIPDASVLTVFTLAFGFGWASDDILNKIITWISG